MGTVYLALDPNIERRVAVKVLRSFPGLSEEAEGELRRRFVREARAAGQLSHPGIVTVHDAERDPETGSSFIAMEWVEGSSLEEELRDGLLPVERVIDVVVQVAEALDAAHAAGLVHRDVKPANILLTTDGRAKVSDFGVVKFTSMSTTVPGHVLGSPYYMSPEQVKSETVDARSDLFSLGVVLYQCLTGAVPFAAESLAGITYKVLEIDPRPVRSIRPSVPEPLAELVEKAVSKDPDDRFQSGRELAEALRVAASGLAPSLARRSDGGGREEGPRQLTLVDGPARAEEAAAGEGLATTAPPAARRSSARHREPETGGSRWVRGWMLAGGVVAAVVVGVAASWWMEPASPETAPPPAPRAEPRPTSADRSPSAAPAQAAATLVVLYDHRLPSGRMAVLVDELEVWSGDLTASKGIFGRLAEERLEAVLQVGEGAHVVEIRIESDAGGIAARGRIEAFFRQGGRRELRAELIPPDHLDLTWTT